MYKLFLTLRYLTRKKIVVFPILVVWLCVAMLVIVSSIMGGFVENVRKANRELLGDVIVSGRSVQGFARYEELSAELTAKISEIYATTPEVEAYGLVTLSGYDVTRPAQIIGIDPVGRAKVSKFLNWLYLQHMAPEEAVDILAPRLPADVQTLQAFVAQKAEDAQKQAEDAVDEMTAFMSTPPTPHINAKATLGYIAVAGIVLLVLLSRRKKRRLILASIFFLLGSTGVTLAVAWPLIFPVTTMSIRTKYDDADAARKQASAILSVIGRLPPNQHFANRNELAAAIVPKEPTFAISPGAGIDPPPAGTPAWDIKHPFGVIIASQLFFNRDVHGNVVRRGQNLEGRISVVPVSRKGTLLTRNAIEAPLVIVIDDAHSGMFDTDSTSAFAPFEKVQLMAGLRTDRPKGDDDYFEPRTNQLLIKLKDGADLYAVRDRITSIVEEFQANHRDVDIFPLDVQTWDEKQAHYLSAVQNEKYMMTLILGIMSLVVLVVIFLIFYMIVRDKTRDIGIIKAVGGSEEGVAGIFLIYGLFVGLVGGLLGVLSGVQFVVHTNDIHDWIFRITGKVIWDRSVYVFDQIPNTYNPMEVFWYFIAALAAGMLGALIPAIVAGAQDPVKAVRYE